MGWKDAVLLHQDSQTAVHADCCLEGLHWIFLGVINL